jgi:hypothetical protein
MGLDIRLPIGLLFSVLGLLPAAFGAFSGKGIYQRSLGPDVDLAWGNVVLIFGIVMVVFGSRQRTIPPRKQDSADDTSQPVGGRP